MSRLLLWKNLGARLATPTGALHVGNYFGAVKFWIDVQNSGLKQLGVPPDQCQLIVAIADLHALTTGAVRRDVLNRNIEQMAAMLLATGLDEKRTILFQQSAVEEHTELAWILSCLCTVAQLNRLSQFKDKAAAYRNNAVPLGLLTYPVLQAADILLYGAHYVPVGDDQTQHLEMCRTLARQFNKAYRTDCMLLPQMLRTEQARVRSLRSPTEKMSKSEPTPKGRIELTDDRPTVRTKIRKAVTDAYGSVQYDPERRPGVSNLIALDCAVSGRRIEDVCAAARNLDTGRYKLELADRISDFLAPIQERYRARMDDKGSVRKLLDVGAYKAMAIAAKRMDTVRKVVGLR